VRQNCALRNCDAIITKSFFELYIYCSPVPVASSSHLQDRLLSGLPKGPPVIQRPDVIQSGYPVGVKAPNRDFFAVSNDIFNFLAGSTRQISWHKPREIVRLSAWKGVMFVIVVVSKGDPGEERCAGRWSPGGSLTNHSPDRRPDWEEIEGEIEGETEGLIDKTPLEVDVGVRRLLTKKSSLREVNLGVTNAIVEQSTLLATPNHSRISWILVTSLMVSRPTGRT
jgi:hypothetical protein